MSAIIYCFTDGTAAAQRLAEALMVPCEQVAVHHFPDHESLVRIPSSAELSIFYRSLDNPDGKLVELMLAASAARDMGARKVILIAPYLAYMRQDKAFRTGEAVSQRVIGRLLAQHFDAVLTVDPHLHRVRDLSEVMPGIPAIAVTAAPLLATLIDAQQQPVIIGPDGEAAQWTGKIARPLGLEVLESSKERRGDRDVTISIHGIERVRGRPAILVDDVVASGGTLARAASLLRAVGARSVEAIVTHCLASPDDLAMLAHSGIARVSSSDSVDTPTSRIHLATILADAFRENGLLRTD